jgi:arginine-tRNA-protein transferase
VRELEVVPGNPPELVVLDEEEPCTYLPDRLARQPLRMPLRVLSPEELDVRLEEGDRRYGRFLYRQHCPTCRACEALRVDVPVFRPSRSQRRVKKAGDTRITVEVGPVLVDELRVALFNEHESRRGLRRRPDPLSLEGYARFLADTCAEGVEVRYHAGGRLVGVAVADRGKDALSAVYTFYDPDLEALSPGTYSILTQVELCRVWGLRWLYLGLYVADCPELAYKSRYRPHERRVAGVWQRFE